ncbi:MAG: hypothetical protein KF912_08200 [Phycisphaeraceae bacterium]|nr:hypothetical protein [Phycisphaeraceae bacterium]
MKVHTVLSAAALAALAGQAFAQPAVDGKLTGDESFYGAIKWVQNVPTGFGDNHPSNVPPSGDAAAAVTGVEFAIPLSAIGGSAANLRLAGWINSGDRTFMSNQVIGGLPNLGNLGGTGGINFGSIAGDQYITLNPATVGTAPTLDGTKDSIYGAPQAGWLQNNFTGFGDNGTATPAGGGGSEINAVYAVVNGATLYVMITGNVESNGNGLDLFFDSSAVSGGQNVLANGLGGGAGTRLNTMNNLTFDAAFSADYYLTFDGNGTTNNVHFADLNGATGYFVGNGGYATLGGALSGGDSGAPAMFATIDNSNTTGVTGSPPITIPSADAAVGSEINGVYGYVDTANGDLYVLITGNIESNFNKLHLFIDANATDGQNVMRSDNVPALFNQINRFGPGTEGTGLVWDADFAPDYWMAINMGGFPVTQYADAATLRAGGPILGFNDEPYDYRAFRGSLNAATNTMLFDGPIIDIQDGGDTDIETNFAPRLAGNSLLLDPFNPVGTPDAITVATDNSNIAGVTSSSAAGAAAVTTGVELRIRLTEIGWDGSSDIKIGGFMTNGDSGFVSNQVMGGLPDGSSNLGEARAIDFTLIAGNQFVNLSQPGGGDPCDPADYNGDTIVDIQDFLDFFGDYGPCEFQVTPCPDALFDVDRYNPDNFVDIQDFLGFFDIFGQCS